MTVYSCGTCGSMRASWDGPVVQTLVADMAQGWCFKCRKTRVLRVSRNGQDEGDRARVKGEEQAKRSSAVHDPAWSARFEEELSRLIATGESFTSEDVTAVVGLPENANGSAVGARIAAAARKGRIEWTGELRKAARASQHSADLKVWRAK